MKNGKALWINGKAIAPKHEIKIIPYLTFESPESFTLATNNTAKNWNGTLEYSTDATIWNEWDGTTTLTSALLQEKQTLFLRGVGNTKISESTSTSWTLTGANIACKGNIENLLDYTVVAMNEHPSMAEYCYKNMFNNCTNLISAPELPATALTKGCYYAMFYGCSNLTQAPELPAIILTAQCYYAMFYSCSSLIQTPELPATTLANQCYYAMFYNCSSLIQTPELPATVLTEQCYYAMFDRCTSLTQAPALPATTLANQCYMAMFEECSNLIQAPALPATELATECYHNLFYNCTSLIKAPALPATTLVDQCYRAIFYKCNKLKFYTASSENHAYGWTAPSNISSTNQSFMFYTAKLDDTTFPNYGKPVAGTTYYYDAVE